MVKKGEAWPAGIKKTKQRELVLRILENAAAPLTVLDIFNRIEKDKESVWLSTVYRILDLFVARDIVVKTTVMDSDMAFYEINRHKHRHYAVCVDCHKIVEFSDCPITEFKPRLSDGEFRVLGHKVEMYGYCRDCGKGYTVKENGG